jgi:hypothetical protein
MAMNMVSAEGRIKGEIDLWYDLNYSFLLEIRRQQGVSSLLWVHPFVSSLLSFIIGLSTALIFFIKAETNVKKLVSAKTKVVQL